MSSSENQWHFNCVSNNGTRTSIRTAICNTANWTTTGGQSWNTNSSIFTITDGNFPSGVLAVSGANCGCLSGCNLAYSGSTNCTGVSGDCSAGYQAMSRTIIFLLVVHILLLPKMKNRGNGCSASGADGNCQTCDVVKVDILSGSKSFQQGASNSSLLDSYSSIGPSTIIVSGRANRADEIITYSIKATPCNCLTQLLPMELLDFKATLQESSAVLNWATISETNTSYFIIERSQDAVSWETISQIEGAGNSQNLKTYSIYDSSPLENISYYRLKQVDDNGSYTYSKIESVSLNKNETFIIYPNPNENGILKINVINSSRSKIKLIDALGKIIYEGYLISSYAELDLTAFEKGVYVIFINHENGYLTQKSYTNKANCLCLIDNM